MANKSIKRNYIYNVLYEIFKVITPFITAPYLARVLGADGIGTVSFAESIVSYFVLFATMGIARYGQREISYIQDDRCKRSVAFWNIKILECCTSCIVLVVYFFFAACQENQILYYILSINIIAVFVDVTWFFQGMEEFGKIVVRNLILKIMNILYIFIFVKSREDIVIYALGTALFVFFCDGSLWLYLPKYISKVKIHELNPFKDLAAVISLFIPSVAIQVYTVLDKTMIGIITQSAFENGYYEQAIKISKITLQIVTALGTVMVPRIGFLYSNKKYDDIRKYMYRSYNFVWFLGIPLCFGLIGIADTFVPWFYGEGYSSVIPLLQILSFLILAIGINSITGVQFLIPTKRQNIFTVTVVIGAVVNFSLNMVLIPQFQAVGAAIASVIAEVVIAAVQLIIVRKELSIWQITKLSWKYLIAGGVMYLAVRMVSQIPVNDILVTFAMITIGAVAYFIMLIILQDSFLFTFLNTVFSKIKYKKIIDENSIEF